MEPGCNERGSTVPENFITSTVWFRPICFSPLTTRWPLGSTSMTVVVMVPVKVLAASTSPLPEKVLSVLAPRLSLLAVELDRKGKAVMPDEVVDLRAVSVDTLVLAVTLSTIWMVTTSPTRRARRSSKAGR